MKVLHLLDSPDRGGTEILILDLCRNSKNTGLDVTLVVASKGILFDEFKSSGVDFYFIERKKPIDFRLIFKLKRIIKEKGIELIHIHQAVDGMHAYFAALFTKVKIVMSFHGLVPSVKDDLVLKFLIPRVNANVSVSKSFFIRLKEESGFRIRKDFHIIYNGIDPKKFYKTQGSLKKELGLLDSDLLLGMVGNFNDNIRDQITICKALPDIFKKYNHIHFVFIGRRPTENPKYYDECISFCKMNEILDRSHFIGVRSDINNILNSLDIFVYSSNYDTFGIAVIEAMFSELPIIINDLPPLIEITDGGKYAKVFNSKDYNDLREKIIEVIKNKNEYEELSKKAKEWAIENYSIEKHIMNLKNLYKTLINYA